MVGFSPGEGTPERPSTEDSDAQTFEINLIREHLEEIAFLLSQYAKDPFDPEPRWPDVADTDTRLNAHKEAISLFPDAAFECALQMLDSDVPRDLPGDTAVEQGDSKSE